MSAEKRINVFREKLHSFSVLTPVGVVTNSVMFWKMQDKFCITDEFVHLKDFTMSYTSSKARDNIVRLPIVYDCD